MPILHAELQIDGRQATCTTARYSFRQAVDYQGRPSSTVRIGLIEVTLTGEVATWPMWKNIKLNPYCRKSGHLAFFEAEGHTLKSVAFYDAALVYYESDLRDQRPNKEAAMQTTLRFSAAMMEVQGQRVQAYNVIPWTTDQATNFRALTPPPALLPSLALQPSPSKQLKSPETVPETVLVPVTMEEMVPVPKTNKAAAAKKKVPAPEKATAPSQSQQLTLETRTKTTKSPSLLPSQRVWLGLLGLFGLAVQGAQGFINPLGVRGLGVRGQGLGWPPPQGLGLPLQQQQGRLLPLPMQACEIDEKRGGHSYVEHGAQVTPAQHEVRLRTGQKPSGDIPVDAQGVPKPPPLSSSSFSSDAKHLEALDKADQKLPTEKFNKKRGLKKKVEVTVDVPNGGSSYSLDSNNKTISVTTDKALAVYKLENTEKGEYELVTLFPVQ